MSDPTNTRQDELKNCPLCGKQPKLVYLAGWEIICLCGVNLCLENPGKAPLITAWNARSGDSGRGDDSARLNWIEQRFNGMTNGERYLPREMLWGKSCNGRTLREAIDKYMKREAPTTAASQGGEG